MPATAKVIVLLTTQRRDSFLAYQRLRYRGASSIVLVLVAQLAPDMPLAHGHVRTVLSTTNVYRTTCTTTPKMLECMMVNNISMRWKQIHYRNMEKRGGEQLPV